jgi:hypothetical protein
LSWGEGAGQPGALDYMIVLQELGLNYNSN